MTCKVVHCKKAPYDVYIGRPSKWGNPFTHLKPLDGEPPKSLASYHVDTRELAISSYKRWLINEIIEHRITENEVLALDGKTLGCWCHPKPCHGDAISEVIEDIKQRRKENGEFFSNGLHS
jgi:hypothetical protein